MGLGRPTGVRLLPIPDSTTSGSVEKKFIISILEEGMRCRERQPETGLLYFGMGFVSHASEQGSVRGLQGRDGRLREGGLPQSAAARLPLWHWL